MPELPEVEAYRRLAERALERTIAEVVAPDAWYLKRGLTAAALRRGADRAALHRRPPPRQDCSTSTPPTTGRCSSCGSG